MIIEKSGSFIANINGFIVILKISFHKGNRQSKVCIISRCSVWIAIAIVIALQLDNNNEL